MLVFWMLAALMSALAVAFVLVPLLRPRAAAGPSTTEANLEVLRTQRHEIDADVAAGTLPADARDEALAELIGRAAQDLEGAPARPAATAQRPWIPALAAGIAVPALAFGLYAAIGTPEATDPAVIAATRAPSMNEHQIVAMVESLAAKVRERPDDAQGWALLARSMAALERFPEAAEAYAHLAKLVPGDAQILADYADALGMAQGRTLAGRPYELVKQALDIDPKHPKALAIAGTAALDNGDYATAAAYWQRLGAVLPPDSPDAQQVQAVLEEIRGRAAASGKPLPAAPQALAQAPAASPKADQPAATSSSPQPAANAARGSEGAGASAASSVTGSVSIAPAVASKVAGSETLFVFARSEGGPRVPLAIVRASARELPLRFTLDDSQAMAPGMNLSSAQAVRIEARISRSGNAAPQSGDLMGTSGVVKPGARNLSIVIDKVVP